MALPQDGWHYLDAAQQSQGPFPLAYLQGALGGRCVAAEAAVAQETALRFGLGGDACLEYWGFVTTFAG